MIHKKTYYILFFCLFLLCAISSCSNNSHRSKHSKNFYSNRLKGKLLSSKKQCDRSLKKKYKQKNKKVKARSTGKKPKNNILYAEIDPSDTPPPKPQPTPIAKPKEKAPAKKLAERLNGEKFENISIDEKHKIEDEVLLENNIPPPTSEEHEKIRHNVAEKIKKDEFPQYLDPLYFVHDDDEFSVVDMEPFLIAVEYALQGRMILIEGHTDNSGNDAYNVKLSIQRVERIRQLMHDMGVPDERISVVGYGEEAETHDNSTEEGRQKNRRIDFRVF